MLLEGGVGCCWVVLDAAGWCCWSGWVPCTLYYHVPSSTVHYHPFTTAYYLPLPCILHLCLLLTNIEQHPTTLKSTPIGTRHSDGIQGWWTTQKKKGGKATLRMLGNKQNMKPIGAVVDLMLASHLAPFGKWGMEWMYGKVMEMVFHHKCHSLLMGIVPGNTSNQDKRWLAP